MMKPCHATTKYEPTPPRPFSRAFHPINLEAQTSPDRSIRQPASIRANWNKSYPAKKHFRRGWRQLVATTSPASGQPPGGHRRSTPPRNQQRNRAHLQPATCNVQPATYTPPASRLIGFGFKLF